jgi:hypothetical protein
MVNPGPAQEEDDSTWQVGLYVQDLWQVTPNLTLEPGLRIDWQEFVDKAFLAPRIGASWDPTGNRRTQLVANWGQFYDNIFLSALTYARQPEVTISEVFRGPDAVEEFGFAEVPYFRDLVRLALQDVEASAVLVPRVTRYFALDDRLTAPRSTTWSVGLNRVLPKGVRVQANYMERVQDHVALPVPETIRLRDPNEPFTPGLQRWALSTGGGLNVRYKAWTVEMSRAFSNKWGMSASYTQQRATGPVNVNFSTDDPFRFGAQQAVLSRDRTDVIKLGANFDLPWKLSLAANYRYQTGVPITPVIRVPVTTVLGPGLIATSFESTEPLGRNSLRLPPDRALDLTLSRKFKKGDKAYEGRVTVFNITNEYNVYGALALFEPITDPNAGQNLPLRPVILPLFVDVPRSVEFEFRISF